VIAPLSSLDVASNLQDSDSDEEFDEIPVEDFEQESDSDGEESLEQAVRNMHEKGYFGRKLPLSLTRVVASGKTPKAEPVSMQLIRHPEVIDDYIRNFLSCKGMKKTLDQFQVRESLLSHHIFPQNEWFEFQVNGSISKENVILVPDVYQQNQELSEMVEKLKVDVELYKGIAAKARSTYDKLRKERDYHRMHHKRVVQEKQKLISDIKKTKKHYENYEPTLKGLQIKYESAMKEKMLVKLERDRLAGKVASLLSLSLSYTLGSISRNGN
jgi:hypothetical protein